MIVVDLNQKLIFGCCKKKELASEFDKLKKVIE